MVAEPEDKLVKFFGAAEAAQTDSAQVLADAQEARKDGWTRKAEVHTAVADGENSITKQARALGAQMEPARVALLLGESVAQQLEAVPDTDALQVLAILNGELKGLDGGRQDIFANLPDEKATATEGARRRTGQAHAVALKAALLGLSEGAYASGNFALGLEAFKAARIDMVSYEPRWFVDAMAASVATANLEDPAVRTALVHIIESRVLGVTQEMEERVAASPIEELSGQEVILAKAVQARTINQAREEADAAAQLKAEREQQMASAWKDRMRAATADGKDSFEEHFRGGPSYMVRFRESGYGSSHLTALSKDWDNFAQVTNGRRLGGALGYLQVLQNIIETPGYLDAMVAREADRLNSDLVGQTKKDYEQEGRPEAWPVHVRQQILTEIHGNALGMALGAIEYEERAMTEETRSRLLIKALEVLGGGQAYATFINGKGALTPEQALVKNALSAYITNPTAGQEQRVAHDPGLADRRLDRLKKLADLAPQADVAVRQLREEAEKQALLTAQQDEQRRTRLQGLVKKSQEYLLAIDEAREKVRDVQVQKKRMETLWQEPNVAAFVTIERRDKDRPPSVTISLNETTAQQIQSQMQELKQKIARQPSNARELRDELAGLQVEARLFLEMRDMVNRVNRTEYQRQTTRKKNPLQTETLGALSAGAFDAIPVPGDDLRWADYDTQRANAVQGIEEPPPPRNGKREKMQLAEVREKVAAYAQAEDVLGSAEPITKTEQLLDDWHAHAKQAAETLSLRAGKAIVGLAHDLVKHELYDLLIAESRISYS